MISGHVAVVTLHADPSSPSGVGTGGGTHAYVRELMVALAGRGWAVTVLTRWADPNLPESEFVSSKVRILRLRIGDVAPLDKRFLNEHHTVSLSEARRVLVSATGVEMLHSVYWNSGRVALDLGAELGLPFTHTVISNGWRRWHQGARDQSPARIETEMRVFAAAFAIFCISDQEREDLIAHYGVEATKAVVVGRPVSARFCRPCRDEMGRPLAANWPDEDP
jgi:D-inositol-3-phosphate glycosyltransferase